MSHEVLCKWVMGFVAFGAVRGIGIHHQALHSLQIILFWSMLCFVQHQSTFILHILIHHEATLEQLLCQITTFHSHHATICHQIHQLL